MKKNGKQNRWLALALCLCLLASVFPLSGMTYAAETRCTHVHNAGECGYVEAVEGAPCTHVHDEDCGGLAPEGDPAPCTLTEGCTLPEGHEGECQLPMALGASPRDSVPAATGQKTGTWGNCTWEIDGDTLTVKGNGAVGNMGKVADAPWLDTHNPAAVGKLKRLVVGTAEHKVRAVNDLRDGVDAEGNPVRIEGIAGLFHPNTRETFPLDSVLSIDLTHFTIGSDITSMASLFNSCTTLQTITWPESLDTSGVTDMEYLFSSCSALQSIPAERLDTSNVTNMAHMFAGCNTLTSLDVSGFDTSNVTNMGSMFHSCNNLASLDVSGFDTGRATNLTNMFNLCGSLTSIDVSGFDTSNVTAMKGMFADCGSLVTLDLANFDTSKVVDETVWDEANQKYVRTEGLESMIALCWSLSAVRLGPNFGTSSASLDNVYASFSPAKNKEIDATGLMKNGSWVDPSGAVHAMAWLDDPINHFAVRLAPRTMGVGWYLAQPESGSYALFDAMAPGWVPEFIAADAAGTVSPLPAPPAGRVWVNQKTGVPAAGTSVSVESGKPTAFIALYPLKGADFKVTGDAVYDGQPHAATITPPDGAGAVSNVRYALRPNGTATDTKPIAAGTYDVICDVAMGDAYTSAEDLVAGTLTVNRAPLTFRAADTSTVAGAELPALTYTVEGLVAGDKVTKEPTLTVQGDTTKPGECLILVSDAGVSNQDSYDVAYEPGTLKVTARTPQTGDTTNMPAWMLLMLAALLGCGSLLVYRRLGYKKWHG